MALTVSNKEYTVFGNKSVVVADVAFDSSYPYGGESLAIGVDLGLHTVDLALIEPKNGYSFAYDRANNKIQAFRDAPPIVYEEHHVRDSTTGVITLDYPAAWIQNVAIPGQNLAFRSTAIALASLGNNQCCLTAAMAAGTRTQLTTNPALDDLAGDGAFTGAATNWTLASGWAYGTNNIGHTGNGTGTAAHDNFACVIGRTYKLTYTISSWTVGTVTPAMGGVTGTAVGADGTYTEYFTATAVTGLTFTPTNTARFVLDTVTIVCQDVFVTYCTQAWKDVWENLVQDESVTLASGGTSNLTYAVAAVMYADRTSTTAKALVLIDEDDTAASGEIAIYFNKSTAQIKATHADENTKVAKITYLKKPSSGFLKDRSFWNEGATKAGSDPYTNTFDYPALLWGYSGQVPINGGTTQVLIDFAGTPAAGEAVIDWFNPGTRGAGAPATGTVIGSKSNVTATGAGIWGTINEIQAMPLEVKNGEDLSALTAVRIILIGT